MSIIGTPRIKWPDDLEGIYHPSKEEHPVVSKLKSQNYYLKNAEDGRHLLICPFHRDPFFEHNVAIYRENSRLDPHGWFTCNKCECHKSPHLFYERIGVYWHEILNRSVINLAPGFLNEIVESCEKELAVHGKIFQRGGMIVKIGVNNHTGEIDVAELSVEEIRSILSERSCFLKFFPNKAKWEYCDLPIHYCINLHKAGKYRHLSELQNIAIQSYFRADGSLVTTPGYDRDTGIFSHFEERMFNIPIEPTRQEAENALQRLKSLLSEFEFKTSDDLSATLSAILTASIRTSLSKAPMTLCTASQVGSGKSLLMQCIAAFASLSRVASLEFPRNEEESRKQLFAYLLKAPLVTYFDNVTFDLTPHPSLCTILTEESYACRILGRSVISEVSTRSLILINGNNIRPTKDLIRRTITINLHPTCENPTTRKFANEHLLEDIYENRSYYVSLALTIIRAWIVAGRPITEVESVATYIDWSNYCRQALLWLGL